MSIKISICHKHQQQQSVVEIGSPAYLASFGCNTSMFCRCCILSCIITVFFFEFPEGTVVSARCLVFYDCQPSLVFVDEQTGVCVWLRVSISYRKLQQMHFKEIDSVSSLNTCAGVHNIINAQSWVSRNKHFQ